MYFSYNLSHVRNDSELIFCFNLGKFFVQIPPKYLDKIIKNLSYSYKNDDIHKYAYAYALLKNVKKLSLAEKNLIYSLLVELKNNEFIPAYNLLGNCYYSGIGCRVSMSFSKMYHRKAHENGFIIGTENLALHYIREKNYSKAKELIEIGVQNNYALSLFHKGLYIYGGEYGYEQDVKLGYDLMVKASILGYRVSSFTLGEFNAKGVYRDTNHYEAIKFFDKGALYGDIKSCYYLGKYYLEGIYINRDYDNAYFYLNEASNGKNKDAMAYLGICYIEGYGCYKDYNKGVSLIKEALNLGSEDAKNIARKYNIY